ncbi:MAG: DUF1365 domain-containing protein [Gammaproteobacteria bacterium]|jgi:uncharacterized protein|nr:DUF1365 domain-containing protein [Gammaproteobacteria bacterium]MBT5202617.1 DUF1365 domain-containing protein [Gammaproteobacteria bacterium]MBT5602673.1 DUF1365 domain-containing protein [Gammaproteobacteria bacterium]MBT6245454.1 DUF1365 domain-containing protein [Gammaproteobacteria bacterium]
MEGFIAEGWLRHERGLPTHHGFSSRHACVVVNTEHLDAITSLLLPGLLAFRRCDYLPSSRTLSDEVRHQVNQATATVFEGDIYLVTNLRGLGVLMNPLSLFVCMEAEKARYLVVEVTNTPWDERYSYVVNLEGQTPVEKKFHVSPFMPMDTVYQFTCSLGSERIGAAIDVKHQAEKIFSASLNLNRIATLNSCSVGLRLRLTVTPIWTLINIYIQASLLFLKRLPFHAHPKKMRNNA